MPNRYRQVSMHLNSIATTNKSRFVFCVFCRKYSKFIRGDRSNQATELNKLFDAVAMSILHKDNIDPLLKTEKDFYLYILTRMVALY
jgi:hypothetical protein